MNSEVKDEPTYRRGNKTRLRLSTKRKSRKNVYKSCSLVNIKKSENSQFMDTSDDLEEHIHQFKIGLNQESAANNNLINPIDCGYELVKRKPRGILKHPIIKPLISTSLKREENLRTYTRRPKNSEIIDTISTTSKVIFSNKESTASHCTTILADTPDFEDCSQNEMMQFPIIKVKMENDESEDTLSSDSITDNIKYEVVREEYNEHNSLASTDDNFIKNVPSLQHEITKSAEEIIKRTRSKRYDLDTLNFIREQLHQVLDVLESAEQTSVDLIS